MATRLPSPRRGAMTLIELLLVIVVLAALLAVGLPRLTGTNERAALTATARDLARLANYARQSAISQQAPVAIHFSAEQRTWQLELPPPPEDDRRFSRRNVRLLSEEEQPRTLHSKVSFLEFQRDGARIEPDRRTGVSVEFYPNGTSNGLTVVLANTKGRRMSVSIERATGRVSAYDGEPMTFGDLVAQAGGDISLFAGAETSRNPTGTVAGAARERFYRVGESSNERTARYEDAAARIMGRVKRQYEAAEGRESGGRSQQP